MNRLRQGHGHAGENCIINDSSKIIGKEGEGIGFSCLAFDNTCMLFFYFQF